MRHFWCAAAAAARRPSGRELGWSATLSIDDPVDIIADDDEIVIRRQRPRVTMDELLARFGFSRTLRAEGPVALPKVVVEPLATTYLRCHRSYFPP
jgi:hypothetical protein